MTNERRDYWMTQVERIVLNGYMYNEWHNDEWVRE